MGNTNTGIVIVGSGLAGYTLAREFRKLAAETPVTIITRDDGRSYSKPQLSTAFAHGKTADQLSMASADYMASQLKATIRAQTTVTALDPKSHTITLNNESTLSYTACVLAMGARQNRPPIQGNGAAAVITINDLDDYTGFRKAISRDDPAPIVLLGAGLIGCELANDLAGAGFNVHVVTLAQTAFAPLLPAALGHAVQTALTTLGVQWHCNTSISTAEKLPAGLAVTLTDGSVISAQAVLSATGLRPNVELAQAAGLRTNRGIVVDHHMKTSSPNVYAIGDCAERDGVVLPYVLPLMNQVRALAKTLAGTPTPVVYPVMPVVVKTPVFPVSFVLPNNPSGRWEIQGDTQGIKCLLFRDGGVLIGFALGGKANNEKTDLVKQLSVNG